MDKIKIKVRKEVVLCTKCGNKKELNYLSDFAYGEKLILIKGGTEYAYVNLLEDEIYKEVNILLSQILQDNNIIFSKSQFAECISNIFGITFDKIDNEEIDTSIEDEKCSICGSEEFKPNLIEPEQIIDKEVPVITHILWKELSNVEKVKKIKTELIKNKFIKELNLNQ